jgi:hypothetical protein
MLDKTRETRQRQLRASAPLQCYDRVGAREVKILRVTDVTLRDQIAAALRTATTLLSENYLVQDRQRLIKCIEALDQANRGIDGGMWTAEMAPDPNLAHSAPTPAPEPRPSLIQSFAPPTQIEKPKAA